MSEDRPAVGDGQQTGTKVTAPRTTDGLTSGVSPSPAAPPGFTAGQPPPGWPLPPVAENGPPKGRRRRVFILIVSVLLVCCACAAGVGIGYGVWAHRTVVVKPTTTPTTSTHTVSAVATKIDPELVDVNVTLGYETATVAGTGMVVTAAGAVVTNNHVIEGATAIHVTDVGTGAVYSATVVGYDITADVAVLQLAGASELKTVSFATSSSVTVGEKVVAIGNAQGRGGTPSATRGTISALDQSITAEDEASGRTEHLTGLLGTDAAIEAGDSGGPLVDAAGKVIGMDTASSSGFAFAHSASEGYAIPSDTVTTVSDQIRAGLASSTVHIGPTAFLGVQVVAVDQSGAVVVHVEDGTPATKAGLVSGDVIDTVGGQAVHAPTTLTTILQTDKPGTTVSLGWRTPTGAAKAGTVTLASGPPS
jgi:S1-C subfamily serine protease